MGDEKLPYSPSPSSDEKDSNKSYRSLLIQEQIKRESVAQLALTTPRTELCVRASIIGTEKCQNPKRDKLHINYIIRVTTGIPNLSWHVHRRYKQFLNLHTQLLEVFSEKELPKLPPKSVGRKFKETFTIKRTKELNDYLTVLAQNTRVSRSEQWASFLVGVFDDIFEHARVKDLQASIALRPTNGQGVIDISKPVQSSGDEEDPEKTIRELKAQLLAKEQAIELLKVERDRFKAEVDIQLNKMQEINFEVDELKQNNLDLESQVKELKKKEESLSIYREIMEKSPRPPVPEPSPTQESEKSSTEKRSSTKKSAFFAFGRKDKNEPNHKDRDQQESDSRDRTRAKTELHSSASNHKSQSNSKDDTKEPIRNFVNHSSSSGSSPGSDLQRESSPLQVPPSQAQPTKEHLDLLQQQKATIEAQEKLIQSLTEEKVKSLAEVTNENAKLKAQKKLLVKEIRSLRKENPSLSNPPPQISPPPSPSNSPSKKKKENKIDKSSGAVNNLTFQFSSSSNSSVASSSS